MASSIFLSLILFHLLLSTKPISSSRILTATKQTQTTGFRTALTRVGRSTNPLPKYTSSNEPSDSLIESPLTASKDLYAMTLAIGTPPVPFSAIVDTGSNLIWTKCKTSGSGLFDTSKSISFSNVDKSCKELGLDQYCTQNYGGDSKVWVNVTTLGMETFIIGTNNKKIDNITFGCGESSDKNFKFGGMVGMGPGELSLVSHLEQRVFSYCLGSRFDPKARSVLLTGSEASILNGDVDIQTTPLVMDESNYYISLVGISVGETRLPVTKSDFAVSSSGDGGMIIDSGTTFTYLERRIIDMISEEFVNQTKVVMKYKGGGEKPDSYYKGLEHCFNSPGNIFVPKLVFHFEGGDWELLRENYIYEKRDKGMACLAFIASGSNEKVSIFGNMQQQNMLVVYDLDKKSLSFKQATCNEL